MHHAFGGRFAASRLRAAASHQLSPASPTLTDEPAAAPSSIQTHHSALLKKAAAEPAAPAPRKARDDTKQAQLIAMLRRKEGATIAQIVAATGWQPHTVRGAFAGA